VLIVVVEDDDMAIDTSQVRCGHATDRSATDDEHPSGCAGLMRPILSSSTGRHPVRALRPLQQPGSQHLPAGSRRFDSSQEIQKARIGTFCHCLLFLRANCV
jgi:hypothetical protein